MLRCPPHSLWLHSDLVIAWFKKSSGVSPKMVFNTNVKTPNRSSCPFHYWTSAIQPTCMISVMVVLIPSLEACLKVPLEKWMGKENILVTIGNFSEDSTEIFFNSLVG